MKRKILLALIFIITASSLSAQMIPELTFRNQQLNVILLTLAEQAEVQIITDSTVSGNASFYFAPMKLETALTLLLDTYNYYYWEKNSVYYVSRIRVLYNENSALCSVDSENVDIIQVLNKISSETKTTILKDSLPRDTSSLHIKNMPLDKVLEIITKKLDEYELLAFDDYYYIKKRQQGNIIRGSDSSQYLFQSDNAGLVSVNAENKRFKELLDSLFTLTGYEYSVLGRNDSVISKFSFQEKSFEVMLMLLMEQGDADYTISDDIFYIFDLDRRETVKKYNKILPITLNWIRVEDLPSLFPSGLASSNNYRLDKNTNTIYLYGTLAQITPIENFITMIDTEGPLKDYLKVELNKLKPNELKNLLPVEFKNITMISVPNTNEVIFDVPPQKKNMFLNFLSIIDQIYPNEPISLKFINAETLMEKLPPSVSKENIVLTADPAMIFYKGSPEARQVFLDELSFIDKPVPQIRYDILVIEYLQSENISINNGMKPEYDSSGSSGGNNIKIIGDFVEQLLSLNFDVVTNFGLNFAMNLSASLSSSDAKIVTSTRLVGISGEKIKFQNTRTSRFVIPEIDLDTGETKPGSTKDVTYGLIIDLLSWVSGNREITMEIKATLSNDASGGGENELFTTSEKVITSNVRTKSGEPIIINGLTEQNTDIVTRKVPILGDIPLLGLLFTYKDEKKINTEVVIYILPVVEGVEEVSDTEILGKYYHEYFADGEIQGE